MTSSSFNQAIDAVITWVDGADPFHAAKLDHYLASVGKKRTGSASSTRFHDAGEVEYCVTSILKFAPWIRKIFIVTDQQVPDLMRKLQGTRFENKVKIIDHREIFAGYEQYLPTFNSSSILTMLWRIPDLTEQFIFFNDDFILIKPVVPENFFVAGDVLIRGKWHWMSDYLPHRWLFRLIKRVLGTGASNTNIRPGHRVRQELSARIVGFNRKYFRLPHVPHAWRRSSFQSFFTANPEVLYSNIEPKLRSSNQFVVEALACHLEISAGTARIDPKVRNVQLKPGQQSLIRIRQKLTSAVNDLDKLFLCVQSLEASSKVKQAFILSWLDKNIGTLEQFLKNEETRP